MVKYTEAIKWPFSDWKKLAIGIAVSIIPIVSLIGTGYQLECAKLTLKRKMKKLPEWENWGAMFVSGLLSSLISLAYMLPGIIIMFASIFSALTSIFINSLFTEQAIEEALKQAVLNNLGLFVVGVLITIIGLFFTPMAIMNYVAKGSFGAAFDLGTVWKKTITGTYFVTVLFSIGYALLLAIPLSILSMILSFTIVIPPIIDAFMTITLGITLMTVYAQAYMEAK